MSSGIVTTVLVALALVALGFALWELARILEALESLKPVLVLGVHRHETESILTLRDASLFTRRALPDSVDETEECSRCGGVLRSMESVWSDPRVPDVQCCSLQCLAALQAQWRLQEVADAQVRMGWRLQGTPEAVIDEAVRGAQKPWWERGPEWRPDGQVFHIE